MTARAQSAQATYDRILDAAVELVVEGFAGAVTLNAVAKRADVTVQTVIRRFGTRARLLETAFRAAIDRGAADRGHARPGDVAGAVSGLLGEYEDVGDSVIRTLAQEERVPEYRVPLDLGRAVHRNWVAQAFEPFLAGRAEADQDQLLRALIVVTDIYAWKLLRRDMQLERDAAEALMRRMIEALVSPREFS